MLTSEIATPLSHQIEPAFLDTTVCILRYFGTNDQRMQINETLTQRKQITSSFVFMEYKRVTMRTCVEFHRLLTQVNDVSEALRYFSQSFSMSQLSFGYLMLSEILRSVGPDASQVLDYLENLIEDLLVRWFMRGIDELLDETHCRFAFAQPLRLGKSYAEGFMHINRQTFDCELPAFIESHRKEFTAIHVHFVSEKRRSTAKLRRALVTVLDNPQRSRGRNAWVMGDCVIAVEMPENACLFTTNLRDFQPICTAIGKKVVGAL